MPYQPILGTLAYILSEDRREVLLIHRNARAEDEHLGKYNGLGGKLESQEDIVTGIKREIYEEAGIHVTELKLRGTINWPGFGKNGEDWFGYVFLVEKWEGLPFRENEEGTLSWVPMDQIFDLPMWEGDRYFLPLVFDEDPRAFHGVMPYEKGRPVSWTFVRI